MFGFLHEIWSEGWTHIVSHASYFGGVSMLIPVLGESWNTGKVPWDSVPLWFWGSMILIFAGLFVIFWAHQSISRSFRTIGWMMVIPGIIALIFSSVGSESFYNAGRTSISGFAVIEPGVRWLIAHNVPHSFTVGVAYIVLGAMMIWIGNRVFNLSNYL